MPNLPSGLRTYEASETVRRIAQNENVEATDALFDSSAGHQHTGKPGDAPPIGQDGLAAGAVTTDKLSDQAVANAKLADAAVTGSKVKRNELDRAHLRSSGVSSNIAKYKSFTVTAGSVFGEPTTPYTYQGGDPADNHMWSIPNSVPLPQSITIDFQRVYFALEGMSFGSWSGSDPIYAPKGFYIEGSSNNATWTRLYTHSGADYELYTFIPFNPISNWRYIRLTITESKPGASETLISSLAVYTRYHGDLDLDVLDDRRAWGLNARLQGIIIMPEGKVTDNGNGLLTFGSTVIVMNPAAGTYFRIQAGTYPLGTWGYLYVDLPFIHGATVTPSIGTWTDSSRARSYDSKSRMILAQRQGNGNIYLNSAFHARLGGTIPDADKVDGIDFRTNGGRLEFNDGSGWKGVGIKSVQRGVTALTYSPSSSIYENAKNITISSVDMAKSFVTIHQTGYTYTQSNNTTIYKDTGVHGRLTSTNNLYVYSAALGSYLYSYVAWEVVEFA